MATLNSNLNSIDKYWKGFPNLHQEMGSYSFFSLMPRINSCNKEQIDTAFSIMSSGKVNLTVDEFTQVVSPIKVMVHEWTHWIDHTTTLWGMGLIASQFQSIVIREDIGRVQKEGGVIVRFVKDTKLLHYPEYYTDYGSGIFDLPWKYQYSMGRLFDVNGGISSDPLVFTRFIDIHNKMIVRVPFSIASLLECSAVAQELFFEVGLMQRLELKDRHVEERLLNKRCMEFVYEPMLGTYSVAVHCVSNALKNSDILSSLQLSYYLSRVCLNFPKSKFSEIKIRDEKFSEFGGGATKLIENKDRGFLYLLLASYIEPQTYHVKDNDGVRKLLSSILSKIGIDSLNEVEEAYWREYQEIVDANSELGNPILTDIVNEAIANAKEIGFLGALPISWHKVTLPVTALSDGTVFVPENEYKKKQSGMDTRNVVEYLEKMGRRCHEFYDACLAL